MPDAPAVLKCSTKKTGQGTPAFYSLDIEIVPANVIFERRYHWALLIGPKLELTTGARGIRVHAMERMSEDGTSAFEYREEEVDMRSVYMLLVRIQIAKIINTRRLLEVLRTVPVRTEVEGWNCVAWVREALVMLAEDRRCVGRGLLEWYSVRDASMKYARRKAGEHRFDGKANPGEFDMNVVATYDLLEERETIR